MENILNYPSDSDSSSQKDTNKEVKLQDIANQNKPVEKSLKADQNEDLKSEEFEDLNDLIAQQELLVNEDVDAMNRSMQRFADGSNSLKLANDVTAEKNHTSGHVEEYYLSAAKFDEQFYTFQNFGHAQDPTFNRGGNLIHAEGYRKVHYEKDAHGPITKQAFEYKKELKKKRKRQGSPGKEDFLGPWAFYEGEEDFRVQKFVKTKEQKKMEESFDSKRQQKLEEKQREEGLEYQNKNESDGEKDEEKEDDADKAAVKSYTIFHGKVNDEEGKSFLTPPSYLEPGEHS